MAAMQSISVRRILALAVSTLLPAQAFGGALELPAADATSPVVVVPTPPKIAASADVAGVVTAQGQNNGPSSSDDASMRPSSTGAAASASASVSTAPVALAPATSSPAPATATNPLDDPRLIAGKILVLRFEAVNPNEANPWIGKSIQESLAADLLSLAPDRVVSADQAVPNVEAALSAAKQYNARYVIAGGFVTSNGVLRVTGQLLDTISGGAVSGLKATGDPTRVFQMEDTLAAQVKGQLFPDSLLAASRPPAAPAQAAPQPAPDVMQPAAGALQPAPGATQWAPREIQSVPGAKPLPPARRDMVDVPSLAPSQGDSSGGYYPADEQSAYYSPYADAPAPAVYGVDESAYVYYPAPTYTYDPVVYYSYPAYGYGYGYGYDYAYPGFACGLGYGFGFGCGFPFYLGFGFGDSCGYGGYRHGYGYDHGYDRGGYNGGYRGGYGHDYSRGTYGGEYARGYSQGNYARNTGTGNRSQASYGGLTRSASVYRGASLGRGSSGYRSSYAYRSPGFASRFSSGRSLFGGGMTLRSGGFGGGHSSGLSGGGSFHGGGGSFHGGGGHGGGRR